MTLLRVFVALTGVLALVPGPAGGAAVKVLVDAFACDTGPYAVILPKYYPTLHGIGRHTFTDLEVRTQGPAGVTTRRIEYYGLRLDVRIASNQPNVYQLLGAEVKSRRWSIGRLSVGQSPWRQVREPALEQVSLNGPVELVGKTDTVLLVLLNGRVESADFRCGAAGTR
jgi:hypothetical protein